MEASSVLNAPIFEVNYILNINNEDVSSIVLKEGYFSNAGNTGNILYQYKNSYNKVIDN